MCSVTVGKMRVCCRNLDWGGSKEKEKDKKKTGAQKQNRGEHFFNNTRIVKHDGALARYCSTLRSGSVMH